MSIRIIQGDVREELPKLAEDYFDCIVTSPPYYGLRDYGCAVPARILDPFAGAGTTGLVADRLGRDCTLIDLNTSYIDIAVNRIRDDAPLFAEVAAG